MTGRLRLRVLTTGDVDQIHQAVLRLLERRGVRVQDRDTEKRLLDHGCRRDADGYVRFGGDLVQKALDTVPRRMVLYDRNGRRAVDTADGTPRFAPGINCIDVLDHRSGRVRRCRLDDVVQAARLCDRLAHMDMAANLGNPEDVAFEEQALAGVRAVAANTRKPLAFIAHHEDEAARIWQYLAELAGGWQALADRPFALDLTGPTSPFTLKQEACRRLRQAAARSLPVVCYPCLFPGISGPMTLAGAIAQSSAEVLAGIVIHQLERPGAPVISGSAVVPMDMRTVNLSYGSPEYALAGLAAVDYFEAVGIPTWIGAGCTDAHRFDEQAVAEASANMFSAALSGTAFIHNLGFLASGKTGSLELLVLCDELAGMLRKMVRGVDVSPETLAVEAAVEVSRSGKFLTHPHTRRHVRDAMWTPDLFQRYVASAWRDAGAKTTRRLIREKLDDLLDS